MLIPARLRFRRIVLEHLRNRVIDLIQEFAFVLRGEILLRHAAPYQLLGGIVQEINHQLPLVNGDGGVSPCSSKQGAGKTWVERWNAAGSRVQWIIRVSGGFLIDRSVNLDYKVRVAGD